MSLFRARPVALRPLVALLACAGIVAGCSADPTGSSGDAAVPTTVAIDTFVYEPKTLEVEAGATVEWTNGDDILHTVTSGEQKGESVPGVSEGEPARPDGQFDLQLDGEGTTASFTFEEKGTYDYFCTVHEAMSGRVIVR